MSLTTSTSRINYTGNGIVVDYPFPYLVYDPSHLAVYLDGVLQVSGYSVSSIPSTGDTPTITFTSPPANGVLINILRTVPNTQQITLQVAGAFPAKTVEKALDLDVMGLQQFDERLDRSLAVPVSEASVPSLPSAANRANKYLAFDSNGDPQAVAVTTAVGTSVIPTGGSTPRLLEDLFSFPIRLRDKGAAGDGVTDDAAALQGLVTAGAKWITGEGRTYKINSPITGVLSGQVFSDMILDFSSMPAQGGQDICLHISGTKGTPVSLTSNTAQDGTVIAVGSTATFAVDQWVWLESTALFSNVNSVPYGQIAKVKSVDSGTQVTLYEGVVVPFNTAASATISPLTPVERVRFKNVKILGATGTDQVALWYDYALDGTDEGLVIQDVENAGVVWYRCINMRGTGTVRNAQGTNAYGYGIYGGCYGCKVIGGHGDDLRHFVTIGDNDGINLFTSAIGNTATNMRSAGVDSHPASMFTIFADNLISLAGNATSEGITVQGLHPIVKNNIIKGVGNAGWGIMFQPLVNTFTSQATISENHIYFNDTSTGTTVGIQAQVEITNGANIDGLTITGNRFYGGANATTTYHIYIQPNRASSTIRRLTISGNISVDAAKTFSAYIRAVAANSIIQYAIVSHNHFRASGTYALLFQADGSSANIDRAHAAHNTLNGGSTANLGILASGGSSTITRLIEANNSFENGGLLYSLSGTTTGVRLGSARYENFVTNSSTTYTIVPTTDAFIMNVGATVTLTLPTAATYPGRELFIKNIQANTVNSASSDVQPIDSPTAGTAILPATDGAWCFLKSNGTDWVVMQRGT